MWITVFVSAVVLNAVLLMIHVVGPKSIVLTWIPGRNLLLIGSLLYKPELLETLRYAWAAGIIPVMFLLPLHAGVRLLSWRGRMPRFYCAKFEWILVWLLTLFAMTLGILLIGLLKSEPLNITLGAVAILLNILNVIDAPQHLEHEQVHLTIGYVLGTNVAVLAVLILMNYLLDIGELVWAGVVSNVPLLAFVLVVGSTCDPTPRALKLTGQHIYMMSYQIWPNMAFVGILWATLYLGVSTACILASVATLFVLAVQYLMIKTIL